jgi:hypothetical protein
MPVINVLLSEIDHDSLEEEHAALVAQWPRLGHKGLPPTFAQWLGKRLMINAKTEVDDLALGDIRVFNAIEKLVTSLPQHGFNLAYTAPASIDSSSAAQALAQSIVGHVALQPQYAKRLQELFMHYLKNAKEIADTAQVGITNRAYGALTEAHRQLTERTSEAVAKLGVDKAIGRVEGATAILVGMEVMDRATAKKRTSAFKAVARANSRPGWVGRMFGDN